MSNWNLNFSQPTTPQPPAPEPTERVAANFRGVLLASGLGDFAREHGIMPKNAVAKLSEFITEDAEMLEMKREVVHLADLNESVIIFGESGTGKELVAKALHGEKIGKFVAINCAAMPETLLESELFGHKAGSFTDAKVDKVGLLETATNGTIFLDEIGEMPIKLQAKLLRALQESNVRRVGDTAERPINCRVVSATNRPLYYYETPESSAEEQLKLLAESFRLDLYWRLAVYRIHISPLRNRPNDIRDLLDAKYDTEHALTEEERDALVASPLYGNCRELEALVKRMKMRKMLAVTKKV